MNGQLDLTIAFLQKQAASIQLLSGNVDNLLAATKKNTSAIAAQENRLLQVGETVTAIRIYNTHWMTSGIVNSIKFAGTLLQLRVECIGWKKNS